MNDDRPMPPPLVRRINAGLERYANSCPWTSAVECAMASERGAAGTADYIRACPVHQPQLVDDLPLAAFLAAARLEGKFLDGPDLADCGCPIEYLQDEGDHQPGCRLADVEDEAPFNRQEYEGNWT